jgi:hypothetical protein
VDKPNTPASLLQLLNLCEIIFPIGKLPRGQAAGAVFDVNADLPIQNEGIHSPNLIARLDANGHTTPYHEVANGRAMIPFKFADHFLRFFMN